MDHQQQEEEGNQNGTRKSDSEGKHSSDYAPYPKLDPKDISPRSPLPPPPPPPAAATNQENWDTFVMGTQSQGNPSTNRSQKPSAIPENLSTAMPPESNPYVSSSSGLSSSSSIKEKMETVRNVLGRWGKKVGETTKRAEDLAGNMWQHCKFLYFKRYFYWCLSVVFLMHSIPDLLFFF
ncbi:GEM-like protein 1 [Macadamia integrifolia]|uniref:GEM-like protein 1 n=1 Tax=Macadamia integrifolia TaxID=60698 RepID=UPI001C4F0F33|nr:GEM-like protein 1 [Macadamia integrifolia]